MTNPARRFFLVVGALALVFALGVASAVAYVQRQGFITVRVCENQPYGNDVSLRFPAALVHAGMPFAPVRELHQNPEYRKHRAAVRAIVRQLSEIPDCDLVTVDGPNEQVRIRKSGDLFIIDVQDEDDQVYLSVPAKTLGKLARWM